MIDRSRIAALEGEIIKTQADAIAAIFEVISAVARSPEEREEMARVFGMMADTADPVMARLAQQVADGIRRG